MNEPTVIHPHFKLLVLDETQVWARDIANRAKKIMGVYLYDQTRHTHCCELTPSYECRFLYSVVDNMEIDDDSIWQELMDEIDEADAYDRGEVRYLHVHAVDGIPNQIDGGIWPLEADDDYDQLVESVVEYYTCNHVI